MAWTDSSTDLPILPLLCPRCERLITIVAFFTDDNRGAWACELCGACSPRFHRIHVRAPKNELERRLEESERMQRWTHSFNLLRGLEIEPPPLDQQIAAFKKKWFDSANVKANRN